MTKPVKFSVGSEGLTVIEDASLPVSKRRLPRLAPDPRARWHAVDDKARTLCGIGCGVGSPAPWPAQSTFPNVDWVTAEHARKCPECVKEYVQMLTDEE